MFAESLTAISPNTCFLSLIVLRALIMTTLTHLQHNYKEFRVSLFYFVIILRWSSFSEASFFLPFGTLTIGFHGILATEELSWL